MLRTLGKIAIDDCDLNKSDLPFLAPYLNKLINDEASKERVFDLIRSLPHNEQQNQILQLAEQSSIEIFNELVHIAEESQGEQALINILSADNNKIFRRNLHSGQKLLLQTLKQNEQLGRVFDDIIWEEIQHKEPEAQEDEEFEERRFSHHPGNSMLLYCIREDSPEAAASLLRIAEEKGGKDFVLEMLNFNSQPITESLTKSPPVIFEMILNTIERLSDKETLRNQLFEKIFLPEYGNTAPSLHLLHRFEPLEETIPYALGLLQELGGEKAINKFLDTGYKRKNLARTIMIYDSPELLARVKEQFHSMENGDALLETLLTGENYGTLVDLAQIVPQEERDSHSIKSEQEVAVPEALERYLSTIQAEYGEEGVRAALVSGNAKGLQAAIIYSKDNARVIIDYAIQAIGKENLQELLTKDNYKFIKYIMEYGGHESLQHLLHHAHHIGGKEFVSEILLANECEFFHAQGSWPQANIIKLAAEYCGAELAETLLRSRDFGIYRNANYIPDILFEPLQQYGLEEEMVQSVIADEAFKLKGIDKFPDEYRPVILKTAFNTRTQEWQQSQFEDIASSKNIYSLGGIYKWGGEARSLFFHKMEEVLGTEKTLAALTQEKYSVLYQCVESREESSNSIKRYLADLCHFGGNKAVKDALTSSEGLFYFSLSQKANTAEFRCVLEQSAEYGGMELESAVLERIAGYFGSQVLPQQNKELADFLLERAFETGGKEGVVSFLSTAAKGQYEKSVLSYAMASERCRPYLADIFPEDASLTLEEFDAARKHEQWQVLGTGNLRWQEVFRRDAPDGMLEDNSPAYFKPKLYDQLLPLMRTAYKLEGQQTYSPASVALGERPGHPNGYHGEAVWAYKIAVLFSNIQEADRYLTHYAQRWHQTGNTRMVHDALLFEIPKSGNWTPNKWKDLVTKYGPAVSKHLQRAPEIETHLEKNELPFPTNPTELKTVLADMSYERFAENPDFALIALEAGLKENDFNRSLDIIASNVKERDNIPELFIDGASLDDEFAHSFYMEKLPLNDPKGLVLGAITNCCQSIGNAGEECALHGFTSENGGFYVIKHKTRGKIREEDPIIGMSWVWRGKKGELVFDSYERLGAEYDKIMPDFYEEFAHEMADQDIVVHIGKSGNTPDLSYKTAKSAKPVDYNAYRDSEEQWVVPPVKHKVREMAQEENRMNGYVTENVQQDKRSAGAAR